jgi:hypothetical protein
MNKLHTTALGAERIKRNLGLDCDDVVAWCKRVILNATDKSKIRIGKNWYVYCDGIVLTINSTSNTIITAKKTKHLKLTTMTNGLCSIFLFAIKGLPL